MPDLYRFTFAFSGRKQGWSESYVLAQDQTGSQDVLALVVLPIAIARANLLARDYVMDAIRVAKIRLSDGTPVTRNAALSTPDLAPTLQTVANEGEQPRDCALIQANGADGQGVKFVFMRGIPDQIAHDGGKFNPNGAGGWQSRFDSWRGLMLSGAPKGWLEDEQLGPDLIVESAVVLPNLTHTITFGGTPFAALAIGSQHPFVVRGINGKSRLNGRRNYVIIDNNTMQSMDAVAAGAYQFGGTVQRYNPVKPFQAANNWFVSAIRTHDTGRPLYATRGRQSAAPKV